MGKKLRRTLIAGAFATGVALGTASSGGLREPVRSQRTPAPQVVAPPSRPSLPQVVKAAARRVGSLFTTSKSLSLEDVHKLRISKQTRTLTVFDSRGIPLRVYPITYGEREGDRTRAGDRTTPEGVFRVTEVEIPRGCTGPNCKKAPKIRFDTTQKQIATYLSTYGQRGRRALAGYKQRYGAHPDSDREVRTRFNPFASRNGFPPMWFGVHIHSERLSRRTAGCPGMGHNHLWDIGPVLHRAIKQGRAIDLEIKR